MRRGTVYFTLCVALAGVLATLASNRAAASSLSCPSATSLVYPANPRGAVPAAKAYSFGGKSRVIGVKRARSSPYAASARRACGEAVLRVSVYVQVHPRGMRCSACDGHLYLAKPQGAPWLVWASY